tara:strand:+ start:463 stop:678 length:216 start_codon:yes stop_codon:yes gene_type:complete
MKMNKYELKLDITSREWKSCVVCVDAATEDEAISLFNSDPNAFDWEHWKTYDSEIEGFEVERCEIIREDQS